MVFCNPQLQPSSVGLGALRLLGALFGWVSGGDDDEIDIDELRNEICKFCVRVDIEQDFDDDEKERGRANIGAGTGGGTGGGGGGGGNTGGGTGGIGGGIGGGGAGSTIKVYKGLMIHNEADIFNRTVKH